METYRWFKRRLKTCDLSLKMQKKRIEFLSMTLLPKKVKVIEETIQERGIKNNMNPLHRESCDRSRLEY